MSLWHRPSAELSKGSSPPPPLGSPARHPGMIPSRGSSASSTHSSMSVEAKARQGGSTLMLRDHYAELRQRMEQFSKVATRVVQAGIQASRSRDKQAIRSKLWSYQRKFTNIMREIHHNEGNINVLVGNLRFWYGKVLALEKEREAQLRRQDSIQRNLDNIESALRTENDLSLAVQASASDDRKGGWDARESSDLMDTLAVDQSISDDAVRVESLVQQCGGLQREISACRSKCHELRRKTNRWQKAVSVPVKVEYARALRKLASKWDDVSAAEQKTEQMEEQLKALRRQRQSLEQKKIQQKEVLKSFRKISDSLQAISVRYRERCIDVHQRFEEMVSYAERHQIGAMEAQQKEMEGICNIMASLSRTLGEAYQCTSCGRGLPCPQDIISEGMRMFHRVLLKNQRSKSSGKEKSNRGLVRTLARFRPAVPQLYWADGASLCTDCCNVRLRQLLTEQQEAVGLKQYNGMGGIVEDNVVGGPFNVGNSTLFSISAIMKDISARAEDLFMSCGMVPTLAQE